MSSGFVCIDLHSFRKLLRCFFLSSSNWRNSLRTISERCRRLLSLSLCMSGASNATNICLRLLIIVPRDLSSVLSRSLTMATLFAGPPCCPIPGRAPAFQGVQHAENEPKQDVHEHMRALRLAKTGTGDDTHLDLFYIRCHLPLYLLNVRICYDHSHGARTGCRAISDAGRRAMQGR